MPKFSANLSMLCTEFAFLDRFANVVDDGFEAVEYMSPYEIKIAELLQANGLAQALFNLPAGDRRIGARGIGQKALIFHARGSQ